VNLWLNFPPGWLRLAASRSELMEGDRTNELRCWIRKTERQFLTKFSYQHTDIRRVLWERLIAAYENKEMTSLDELDDMEVQVDSSGSWTSLARVAAGIDPAVFLVKFDERYVDSCDYLLGSPVYWRRHNDEIHLGNVLHNLGRPVIGVPQWRTNDKEYDPEPLVSRYLRERGKTVETPQRRSVLRKVPSLAPPAVCNSLKTACRFPRLTDRCAWVIGIKGEVWFNVDKKRARQLYDRLCECTSLPSATAELINALADLVCFRFTAAAQKLEEIIMLQLDAPSASSADRLNTPEGRIQGPSSK
jgi:hypothetical protein